MTPQPPRQFWFNSVPKLYRTAGADSGGFLLFSMTDNDVVHEMSIELDPIHVQLLIVLDTVMRQESQLPWPARGWRHPSAFAQLIGKQTGYAPEIDTIRAYLSRIQGRIRRAVRELSEAAVAPELIERRRMRGARLGIPALDIVDATLSS